MNSVKKKTLSRREFLRYSSLAASAAFLSACGAAAIPPLRRRQRRPG